MAYDITLTGSDGGGITLYGDQEGAEAANGIMYFAVQSGRASPWEIIGYPGSDAIRAKFMGAKPRTFTIQGAVMALATPGDVGIAMDSIMALNTKKEKFTLDADNLITHDGGGLIVEDIETQFVGGRDGVWWRFAIHMRNLGTM